MTRRPANKGAAIRSFIRANHKIRVATVRCVNADGSMVGVVPTREAMKLAQEQQLDLVEISPDADPPVCRIMDYGKFRYEESLKLKQARKNQVRRSVKEIKFHANVAEHDYQTKLGHARGFLENGHKVKFSLTFRGRENAHRELGFQVVNRAIKDCEEIAVVDMPPKMIGRNLAAMLGARPAKPKK